MRATYASVLTAVLLTALVATGPVAPQSAATGSAPPREVSTERADNPLVGHRMGVYKGDAEAAWKPYVKAKGHHKRLLGKIALRPKAKWFGSWIRNGEIAGKVNEYIRNSTHGNSDVLVQMTVFRMVPWEREACRRLPTKREERSYKHWIDRFARATGDAHAAIMLQPDGPFALCAPHHSRKLSKLVGYAARTFSRLPHTSVYIDAGASDWPANDPKTAARILQRAGVAHARGFLLNVTHYTSTAENIRHGAAVARVLARRGIPGKHFVVSTSENGRPFHFRDFKGSHPNNAKVCSSRRERRCVTLGIPPTTAVTAERWGLPRRTRELAGRYADAYLWVGRPWLVRQSSPFSLKRALGMARTTPY